MRTEKSVSSGPRSALRARLRIYAAVGLAILGAWLYYTVNAVLGLYDVTLSLERSSGLRQGVVDAASALRDADESLDRYFNGGQGFDLSRHESARTTLRAALGAIRQRPLTEGVRGALERANAAEDIYSRNADRAVAAWKPDSPGNARALHDAIVRPASEKLREFLADLESRFARSAAFAEERLRDARDTAATALAILAILIVVGVFWILSDVERRIVSPMAAAARALDDIVAGIPPPRLPDLSDDEAGALGRSVNRLAQIDAERARALEERDIESSVNAILTSAATVNDLGGFGSATMEKILDVTGAAAGVLYLPTADGGFSPAISIGGSEGPNEIGRAEATRAARERRPLYVSVEAQTPAVNLFDGRFLPRESAHLPLIHYDHVVGVLALAATNRFDARTRNALTAIAPSLAVALANASANERVAEQSRRLAEQFELLEEQRSRIERTAEELKRAGVLKDRFLASVSHELRTPMTVILGFTATLIRETQGPLNPAQRESLERVQRNARLLLGLINDILDISKIEAGKTEIVSRPLSVEGFLAQIEADFGDAARRKGLRFETSLAPGLLEVSTDPAKLTQIASNLIGNSLKFTESGTITVRAEKRGTNRWAFVVSDTGIGIPEEEQATIFDEFRQGEAPEHRGRGGTGLGLAIVKKIALFLGGTVSLRSARGEGSSFDVDLPVILLPAAGDSLPQESNEAGSPSARSSPPPSPPPSPRLTPESRLPPRPSPRTVLIVDDDEGVRSLLAVELAPFGIRILQAADGAEGLRLARQHRPDAILLDVLMPGVDGWESLRTLRSHPETRNIPVIMLSVVENRAFGFSLGAVDYLLKPLERPDLLTALSRAGVIASRRPVLVVDDDPDVRALLEQELVASGYRVRSVGGGEAALAELAHDRPSAVLLDLMMPPPDGFEVLYAIRHDPALRDLPVIVITAKELDTEESRRLNLSAERVLRKGRDLRGLVREVLAVVERAESEAASSAAPGGSAGVS